MHLNNLVDKKEITMEIRKHFKLKKKKRMNTIGLDPVFFFFGTMTFFFF